MWWLPCGLRDSMLSSRPIGVRVVVNDALGSYRRGVVRCTSDVANVQYDWYDEHGRLCEEFSGDVAYDVPAGRYRIVASTEELEETVDTEVGTVTVPSVQSYSITHATNDAARDGEIVATVAHCDHVKQYLWTTGVVTSQPILRDVRPGTYTVTPLTTDTESCLFVHACSPAVVNSTRTDGAQTDTMRV